MLSIPHGLNIKHPRTLFKVRCVTYNRVQLDVFEQVDLVLELSTWT